MSGWTAVTVASHVVVIFAAMLLVLEVVLLLRRPDAMLRVGLSAAPRTALYAAGVAVIVERLWFVAVRATDHRGAGLWDLHPVPALLSGLVATAVFAGWALVVTEALGGWARSRSTVARHAAFLVGTWAGVAVLLRGVG